MAEITEQFAPFTPVPFTPIDTSRFGIDADKRRAARPEDIALSADYRSEARGFASGGEVEDGSEAERKIAADAANEMGANWRGCLAA